MAASPDRLFLTGFPDPKKCRTPISRQSSTSGKFRWSQAVPVNASSAACSLMVTGNTEGVRKPARPAGHSCRWPPTLLARPTLMAPGGAFAGAPWFWSSSTGCSCGCPFTCPRFPAWRSWRRSLMCCCPIGTCRHLLNAPGRPCCAPRQSSREAVPC